MTDVYLFGEAGLFGARRGTDGMPAAVRCGPQTSPREQHDAAVTGEVLLSANGTLALRGPMTAVAPYTAAAGSDTQQARPDYVDTGYAARIDRASGALCITAPPSGIIAVGGYRFRVRELQDWSNRLGQGALLTALPDRLNGHRLAGRAQDNARARDALSGLGLNPLMSEAFRDSRSPSG